MSRHKHNQKLLMLGIDAALPDLIAKFTREGSMPVTKKLIEMYDVDQNIKNLFAKLNLIVIILQKLITLLSNCS